MAHKRKIFLKNKKLKNEIFNKNLDLKKNKKWPYYNALKNGETFG